MDENSRSVIMIWIVIGVIITFLSVGFWWVLKETDCKIYTNKVDGYRIMFPRDWTIRERPMPGALVAFVSPKENALDVFQENINLTVVDLANKPMTLRQYANLAANQFTKIFKNVKEEESVEVFISGTYGYRLRFRTEGNDAAVIVVYCVLKGDKGYNLTYMGSPERYLKDKYYIDKVSKSLKIF